MRAMAWRRMAIEVASALSVALGCGPALGDAKGEVGSTVERAHARFVSAQQRLDRKALRGMVETFGTPAPVARNRLREYFDLLVKREASGQTLVRQVVERVDTFEDGPHRIAFIRVSTLYTHPMKQTGSPERSTVYAFSRDAGRSWTFNVSDCMSEATLRKAVPAYAGVPGMDLPADAGRERSLDGGAKAGP